MHDPDSLRMLALHQHDVVSRPQALECGITPRQIEARLRHPLWVALERGIYLVRPTRPTTLQRAQASVLHAGPRSVLTGSSALELLGVRTEAEPPCSVLIPRDRRAVSTAGTHIIRTRILPIAIGCRGLPVAPPARAAVDAAGRAVTLDGARAVIAATVQQGFATPEELAAAARGLPRLRPFARAALDEITCGARSVPEAELMRRFDKAGVTGLLFNPSIYDNGQFLCSPDVLEPDTMTALEIDSMEYHLSPSAYAMTQARRSKVLAAGVLMISASPSQVRTAFDDVMATFLAAIGQARRRPTPPNLTVKVSPSHVKRGMGKL